MRSILLGDFFQQVTLNLEPPEVETALERLDAFWRASPPDGLDHLLLYAQELPEEVRSRGLVRLACADLDWRVRTSRSLDLDIPLQYGGVPGLQKEPARKALGRAWSVVTEEVRG